MPKKITKTVTKKTEEQGTAEAAGGEPKKTRKRKSKTALVQEAIQKIQTTLDSEGFKPSVGDFIRLMQYEGEIKKPAAKEVKVKWVDPGATDGTCKP